jgi:hypothetical protein
LVRLPLPSNMFMDPFLTRSIYFEIGHYNLVDEPSNPNDDVRISLLISQGLAPPVSVPLPNFLEGLDGGGGDSTDPAMGLYDESAFQITDPSLFSMLAIAIFNGGSVEAQILVPSSQHIGIDYAGLEVLFVPEPATALVVTLALVALVSLRNRRE